MMHYHSILHHLFYHMTFCKVCEWTNDSSKRETWLLKGSFLTKRFPKEKLKYEISQLQRSLSSLPCEIHLILGKTQRSALKGHCTGVQYFRLGTGERQFQLKCHRKARKAKHSDPTWSECRILQQAGLVSPAKSDLLRFGWISVM